MSHIEKIKTTGVVDYLDCCGTLRTASGCWHKNMFYEGTGETFIRKGVRYDVTDGQLYKDGSPSARVRLIDVVSICPLVKGLYV